MTAAAKMLDKWREVCAHASDKRAAESIGVERQALNQWRKGTTYPKTEHVLAICEQMHADPSYWLVHIAADRAETAKGRQAWLRITGTAAAMLLIVGGLMHQSAEAEMRPPNSNGQTIHMRKSAKGRTDSGKRVRHVLAGVLGTSARRGSGICAGPAY